MCAGRLNMVIRRTAALFLPGRQAHLVEMGFWLALVSATLLIGGLSDRPAAAQTFLEDEFDGPDLNWRFWCPCQIDMKDTPTSSSTFQPLNTETCRAWLARSTVCKTSGIKSVHLTRTSTRTMAGT